MRSNRTHEGLGWNESALAVSLSKAAALLSVSKRTVELRVASGELPSVKIGKRRLVLMEDLHSYIRGLRGEKVEEMDVKEPPAW